MQLLPRRFTKISDVHTSIFTKITAKINKFRKHFVKNMELPTGGLPVTRFAAGGL
ncbi:hypothetical protein TGS27_2162 [Geobacillus stearothermophilus]|uniref:Uncharacterized protein n=1 Tax=Geobacillus stearothermophilus TaxID=1422 RepID=A0ABQ7HGT0_GEOSE|nr:hypothetical protein GS8_974 [Geobacillus stearothermophilus]OAO79580.1 hypothetical protein TGS27_2162 [Geobacillus stearothermophilus]